MEKTISVNGTDYEIVELLGRGKGGYSYLASSCDRLAVLKQIHHEPCDFYTFGNKLESEKYAYSRLKEVGIRIPDMISVDDASEIIVKEYIAGPTIFELVRDGISVCILRQRTATNARPNGRRARGQRPRCAKLTATVSGLYFLPT